MQIKSDKVWTYLPGDLVRYYVSIKRILLADVELKGIAIILSHHQEDKQHDSSLQAYHCTFLLLENGRIEEVLSTDYKSYLKRDFSIRFAFKPIDQ